MTYRQALKSALALLTRKERRSLFLSVMSQILIGTLDIIGVVSVSLTSLLIVRGDESSKKLLHYLPEFLKLEPEKLVGIFAITAVISMISKTLGSFLSTRYLLYKLARIQQRLALELFNNCFEMPPDAFTKDASKDLPTLIADGTENLILGLVGFSMIATAEIFVLGILVVPILIVAPLLTLFTLLIFIGAFVFLHKLLGKWASQSGFERASGLDQLRIIISSVGKLSKVLKVSGETQFFKEKFTTISAKTSKAIANTYFVQQVPKYVLEITVIMMGLLAAVYLSAISSFGKSVGILVLLMATSFRLLPSLLRIQGSILISRTSLIRSIEVIDLMSKFSIKPNLELSKFPSMKNLGAPGIIISEMSFKYPGNDSFAINKLSLNFSPGSFNVIKGESGAGKSTLVDLILGIIKPISGSIEITDLDLGGLRASYMPQETFIFDGSITENIALGIPTNEIDLDRVHKVIQDCDLVSVFEDFRNISIEKIGLDGRNLSGGQYQRIGLARAVYPEPNLIILDEPTSALDSSTEGIVLEALHNLRGRATIIVIAHSSSPEKFADQIITLETSVSELK
jgi:ABC-type multidrug transport system fused ATPase/permease subunit